MNSRKRAENLGIALFCIVALLAGSERVALSDTPGRVGKNRGEVAGKTVRHGSISPEEFITSPFSKFFKEGDYPRALEAVQVLAKEYPGDPLISRYRAMTLDRLGRHDEAIAIYQELLKDNPNHVPTHWFLGQSYFGKGDEQAAREEWKWVVENSPLEEYRRWAQEQLEALHPQKEISVPKRYYLFGSAGVEYDSNPHLKPVKKSLTAPGNEQQAARFSLNLGLGYRLIVRPDFRFDVIYTGRQSFHDGSAQDLDFTSQEVALDLKKRVDLWSRDVVLGARYEFLAGFLRSNLFSIINRFLFSSDIRLTPQTRTYLYNQFSALEFGPDGFNPDQTSRDGFSNDLGITQYFYTADFRRYFFVGQELNLDWTRGSNFKRRGSFTRAGIHTPMPFLTRTDLDLSGGWNYGKYPTFTSLSSLDTRRRQDSSWHFYAGLTHYWTPRWATRGFYRFVNADNRNDFFDYARHIAGIQVLFSM